MQSDEEDIVFEPHSRKQKDAVFSQSKITLLGTGIQFGKTTVGAWWMFRLMTTFCDETDAFIVAAPTYKILEQSTLPAFLNVMEGLGEYNKTKAYFKMHSGGTCYMRTGTEPDSVVGITNVRGIWGDEAGKYSLYFWQNLQGRASFKDCPIMLTTSPYTLNWIHKDLIKPVRDGKRSDVALIQAASIENPSFPKEEYNRQRLTMDPRRFAAMYGGEWGKMSGLVYDSWDDAENYCEPFNLPLNTRYIAGVDWGFTDPFVLKVRAITPDGRHFGISEYYKTGLTLSDMILVSKQKKKVFGIETFYCDPSQPGHIEEFNRNGLSAMGADNDIRRGIDIHYELIKTRKYKEFIGENPYSQDEREMYHYPEPMDLKPDQDGKELLPVGQNDHCMDVDRYITIMTYRSHTKSKPRIPSETESKRTETQEQRFARLMRKNKNTHTERWE